MSTKTISPIYSLNFHRKQKTTYLILISLIYTFLFPQYSWAYFEYHDPVLMMSLNKKIKTQSIEAFDDSLELPMIQGNSLLSINNPTTTTTTSVNEGPICPTSKKRIVTITAYSSSLDETDANPFITASGTFVRDGVIAANFLKFGTKVKIPALYGDKIFIVEDRMASYNSYKIDIWMPSKGEAIRFGVKRAEIVVLEN